MEEDMRQYEIAIRIAQVHHLAEERKYKKALTVIQTLDMRQVRNISDLKVFAEVYTRTEQFEAAKATYLRIYKKSRTRRILYRLIYLAIRTNELDDAESYYKEFVRMNPNNRDALILRYRIDKAAGVPISQLIDTLKSLKEEEYIEEWAYELAKLYQQAGRCEESCLLPRTTRTLTTGFSKPSKGNRYLRAKAMGGSVTIPGEGNAEAHSSGSLSAMIGCNCLVELPAGSGPVTPGEEVEVLSFVQ